MLGGWLANLRRSDAVTSRDFPRTYHRRSIPQTGGGGGAVLAAEITGASFEEVRAMFVSLVRVAVKMPGC